MRTWHIVGVSFLAVAILSAILFSIVTNQNSTATRSACVGLVQGSLAHPETFVRTNWGSTDAVVTTALTFEASNAFGMVGHYSAACTGNGDRVRLLWVTP